MKRGELIIYKADFPDFDPNVQYTLDEIDTNLYLLFPVEGFHFYNAVERQFGIGMDVEVDRYNCKKLQADLSLKFPIWYESETQSQVVFSDKTGQSISIEKSELTNYIEKRVVKHNIVKKEPIVNLGCGTIVHEFLIDDFIINKGFHIQYGEHYLLTPEQISEIDRLVYGLHLKKHLGKDGSQIFFFIENKSNFIFP